MAPAHRVATEPSDRSGANPCQPAKSEGNVESLCNRHTRRRSENGFHGNSEQLSPLSPPFSSVCWYIEEEVY